MVNGGLGSAIQLSKPVKTQQSICKAYPHILRSVFMDEYDRLCYDCVLYPVVVLLCLVLFMSAVWSMFVFFSLCLGIVPAQTAK
jgi:hypothetical protein